MTFRISQELGVRLGRLIVCTLLIGCLPCQALASGAALDPTFGSSGTVKDAFAGIDAPAEYRRGGRSVVLPDGSIIVAGEVRVPGSDANAVAPEVSIGLVKYDAAGTRIPWDTQFDPTYWYFNQYVVALRVGSVDDVVYANGRILVLVTEHLFTRADVIVFSADTGLVTAVVPLYSATSTAAVGRSLHALPILDGTIVTVALSSSGLLQLAKFKLGASGMLIAGSLAIQPAHNPTCTVLQTCQMTIGGVTRPVHPTIIPSNDLDIPIYVSFSVLEPSQTDLSKSYIARYQSDLAILPVGNSSTSQMRLRSLPGGFEFAGPILSRITPSRKLPRQADNSKLELPAWV